MNIVTTLFIGGIFGAVFVALNIPLGWLFGSFFIHLFLSLLNQEHPFSAKHQKIMQTLLGILLGSQFQIDNISNFNQWLFTLLSLIPMIVICVYVVMKLQPKQGFSTATRLFSAVPGGLSEIISVAEKFNCDIRSIALAHTIRLATIVTVIPAIVLFQQNLSITMRPNIVDTFSHWPSLASLLLIAGLIISGAFIADKIKMPAPFLLGPAILTIIWTTSGGVTVELESGLIALLQVAIGANIGRRFKGTKLKEVKPLLLFAFLPTLGLMCFIILFALLFSYFTDQNFTTSLLAVAPGGIGEMGLLAVLVGADQAFVTAHQLTRLIFVLTFLPIFLKFYTKKLKL